jgi:hypothetical protein
MTNMAIKTRHINLNSSGNEEKLSGEKACGKTFIKVYGIMSAEETKKKKKSTEDDGCSSQVEQVTA